MEDLTQYKHLWNGSEAGWCLVQLGLREAGKSQLAIYNEDQSSALIIEDDETYARVIERMLAEGCRVIPTGDTRGS